MTWDTFLRIWRWGSAISLLGVLQFGICVACAAGKYAGGTPVSAQAVGYTFSANFLSDLGRTVAWSGASNREAALLFNTSLLLLAATQIPFFLSLPLHAPDKPVMLWIAAGLGMISCAGLAGVGLTPYDTHLRGHVTALLWWILPLLVALVLHFFALLESEEGHPLFPLASLALAVLLANYALRTLAYGLPPQSRDDHGALLQSIALQKYVVFCCVGWYLLLSVRALLTVRSQLPKDGVTDDRAALDYADRLLRRL